MVARKKLPRASSTSCVARHKEEGSSLVLSDWWTFYYDIRPQKRIVNASYEDSIKPIGSFNTIQDFWRYYNNFVDPSCFPCGSSLRLFKKHIKPFWEDSSNINGGRWIKACEKNDTGKSWITLVLSIIGNYLPCNEEMCGLVLTIKESEATISIWTGNSDTSSDSFQANRDEIANLFNTPPETLYFQPHADSTAKLNQPQRKNVKPNHNRQQSLPSLAGGKKSPKNQSRLLQQLKQNGKKFPQRQQHRNNPETPTAKKKSSSFSSSQFSSPPEKVTGKKKNKKSRSYSQTQTNVISQHCISSTAPNSPLCKDITCEIMPGEPEDSQNNTLGESYSCSSETLDDVETLTGPVVESKSTDTLKKQAEIEEELISVDVCNSTKNFSLSKLLLLFCFLVVIFSYLLFVLLGQ